MLHSESHKCASFGPLSLLRGHLSQHLYINNLPRPLCAHALAFLLRSRMPLVDRRMILLYFCSHIHHTHEISVPGEEDLANRTIEPKTACVPPSMRCIARCLHTYRQLPCACRLKMGISVLMQVHCMCSIITFFFCGVRCRWICACTEIAASKNLLRFLLFGIMTFVVIRR